MDFFCVASELIAAAFVNIIFNVKKQLILYTLYATHCALQREREN